ncbi:MAG: Ig-like domain-containing protein [Bacteroidales bacterium]
MYRDLVKIVFAIIAATLLLLGWSCAKVGSPSGGPSDTTPPRIVKSTPVNYQKNFNGDRFQMTFDEFVTIKNLNNELIISPPLKEKPIGRLRGKTFILDIKNELRDSITYTFNFGNAIVDFTEGNPLANLEFVVTTGNILDTLSLTGDLTDARTLKPLEEPVLVMLYKNLNDSAPLKEIPLYIGRTDKTGKFSINNIKTGIYRVFALKDANNNMIYDLPEESIAFIDSSFVFDPTKTDFLENIVIDTSLIGEYVDSTIFSDSLMTEFVVDSISGDTIMIPREIKYALNVNLFLFTEETKIQYITTKERPEKDKVVICFNRPQFDTVSITPLNFEEIPGTILKEASFFNDTIVYWITDTTIANKDTLLFRVEYAVLDSQNLLTTKADTLRLRSKEKKAPPVLRRQHKEETSAPTKVYIDVKLNISTNGTMNLNSPIVISMEKPVKYYSFDSIGLFKLVDSVEHKTAYTYTIDSVGKRKFYLHTKWDEQKSYRLFIPPGAFTDIYGITNDTLDVSFNTQLFEYYGKIILQTGKDSIPYIIQLLNDKDVLIREKRIWQAETIVFDYLPPGSYKLKAIFDRNKNGKWDTGNYLKKIQPEQIFFNPLKIDLRSNWDVELTWEIQ